MTACLTWGMTPLDMLLNTFSKEADPNSHGRQMPNHYGSKKNRIVSHSSVVSTQYALSTGVAYSSKFSKEDFVVLTTTGEGSFNQGECYEAMNFAAIKKLPIIFVVENNGYAISVKTDEQYASENLAMRGKAFGMPGIRIDGRNFTETYLTFKEHIEYARNGNGPALIEIMLDRFTSHSGDDDQKVYRSMEEINEMVKNDPLKIFEQQLINEDIVDQNELSRINDQVNEKIDEYTIKAETMSDPSRESLLDQVWA